MNVNWEKGMDFEIIIIIKSLVIRTKNRKWRKETGEISQWLRTFASLSEYPSSSLSIYLVTQNHPKLHSKGIQCLLTSQRASHAHCAHTFMQRNTHTYKVNNSE